MAQAPEIKFGTDGWRGMMAREFTFPNVRMATQAVADCVKAESHRPAAERKIDLRGPVIVGYDRRFNSEDFAKEVAGVLGANKLPAILLSEALPTPAVSFATRRFKGLGLMITASHNPPSYNGLKIKWDGRAALPPLTAAVEGCLGQTVPVLRGGKYKEKSLVKEYLAYLRSRVNPASISSRLKRPVVMEYMHGAAGGLLEQIIPSKKIIPLHAERDPLFGGVNPEPIEENLKELSARVRSEKALMGLAVDGDADRFAAVDENGDYLTPCQLFPILILYLLRKKKIRGRIVQSVSLGYLAKRIAKAEGLPFEELPVGFKHVAEELAAGRAAICGEESGGYAWQGNLPERDGLLNSLIFLEMCVAGGKTLSQLRKEVEDAYGRSHFKRIDIRLHRPFPDKALFAQRLTKRLPKKILGEEIRETLGFDGLKIILASDHWLLMRPSGTEPVMRLYAESDSAKRTQELLDLAKKWVAPNLS